MSTAWPTKKKEQIHRAKILNQRSPAEHQIFRDRVKTSLLRKLYERHFVHWNSALHTLSHENTAAHGRTSDGFVYAIYWNNRQYTPTMSLFAPPPEKAYCIPLATSQPDFVKRMEVIAEEMDELHNEKYEAERFILNLLTFNAPPNRIEKVLGATLYRAVQDPICMFCSDFEASWKANNDVELQSFVQANQDIITKMNERIMLNIVSF